MKLSVSTCKTEAYMSVLIQFQKAGVGRQAADSVIPLTKELAESPTF
jgi:hypothetical protein